MHTHSLLKRITLKFSGNFIKFIVNIVALSIIPKALGAELYGDFGFLKSIYNKTIKFLKLGVPEAYFVKLSKSPTDQKIIGFYIFYIISIICIILGVTIVVLNSGFQEIVFPGQTRIYIYAAAFLGFFTLISDSFRVTNDVFGYTANYEKAAISIYFLNALLLFVLNINELISLDVVFLLHYFTFSCLIIYSILILGKGKVFALKRLSFGKNDLIKYFKEFYQFSNPLILHALIIFISIIFDRWLLQYYYGSIEQGFYTISLQIAAVIMLFTGSFSTLILREMSINFEKKGIEEVRHFFNKFTPIFYFLASLLGVFIAINSETILKIIGGDEYKDAYLTLAVLALYPVHQTFSLYVGNVILVEERTKIFRNVSLMAFIPGILITLLFLLPKTHNGLELGATGLAVKTLLFQFFTVNLYLWFAAKALNIEFFKYFMSQLYVLIIIVTIGIVSQHFIALFFNQVFVNLLFSGLAYVILGLIVIKLMPQTVVFSLEDIFGLISRLKKNMKTTKIK